MLERSISEAPKSSAARCALPAIAAALASAAIRITSPGRSSMTRVARSASINAASAAAWSPSISAPMPALVRCVLSMKISLHCRDRAAAASPTSRIRTKSPSTNATKASDCAAAMNDMSSPRCAASAVASADGRAGCRQVAGEHLQGRLVREDPRRARQSSFSRRAIASRLGGGLQSRGMVALGDGKADLRVERAAADGLVVAATGEEAHRSSGRPR